MSSLSLTQQDHLDSQKLSDFVQKGDLYLWVSVGEQRCYHLRYNQILDCYRISTAKAGIGCQENSFQTPSGWHEIAEHFGDGAPEGQVFESRVATERIWHGERSEKDLILTRILWLNGLEEGINLGGPVDSHSRYIYLHGTNQIELLGQAQSAGCVRFSNKDIIKLYENVVIGTRILISNY